MRLATEAQDENKATPSLLKEEPTARKNRRHAHEIPHHPLENAKTEGSEYSALVARATNDAVRDWDVKSGRLAWPQGLESLLGHAPSAASCEIGFWQKHVHPEDRARIAAGIRDALAASEHWSGEYRFRRADGAYVLLLERACILRDETGQAVRFVGSLMDITARRQLHDQLCRSQKMEAFGQLAAGVAHDFNNFLTTILGYSDLLLDELSSKGHVARHLTEIRRAAGRAAALTGQLLAFSRRQSLDPRVLEVNALITNLECSLLRLLGENISVECHLHRFEDGGHIKVDPGQLTQIMLNLVVNARDAMPKGGRLTLATGTLRIDGAQAKGQMSELDPGDYISISVTDNGSGMSDEVKEHLFEPFFTTKDDHRGSGLGLATSYGSVRQSGGQILVKSRLGHGTTVTIYLPRVPAPPPLAYKRPADKNLPNGTETILVLEDDVSVRHISVRVLRSLGYEVMEAANGEDAKQLISTHSPHKIHLLLTDMVMPQMSGRHFADWLRFSNPETRVLFISGYLEESLHPHDRRDHEMFFLQKPFDSEQLAVKVREVLDAKG